MKLKNLLLLSMLLFCIPLNASQSSTSESKTAVQLAESFLECHRAGAAMYAEANAHFKTLLESSKEERKARIEKIKKSGSRQQLEDVIVLSRVSDAEFDLLQAKYEAQSKELQSIKDELHQTKRDRDLYRFQLRWNDKK